VVTSVLWWVGLVLVWVASLTTVSVAELAVAAGAAAVCVLVARVARRVLGVQTRLRARWLREAWRLPWVVLTDTVAVWRAALRGMRKQALDDNVREVPLGGERSRARQAVAIMLLSAAPRTMVIGLDRRTNTVLLHGFGAEEGPMERAVRR
jgi:multisubunit Na+/H+ antiporter MnhE subunit